MSTLATTSLSRISARCPHCRTVGVLSYYRIFVTRGWYCLPCFWSARPQPGWWRR